jgi:hypothetical protein
MSSRHLSFWQVPYLPERPFQKVSRRSQKRKKKIATQAVQPKAEGNDADAQASAATKALADAAAAAANTEATAAQANAAKEKALTQATQVQRQTKPEVPLESDAEKVQPEDQLGSTAKGSAGGYS